MGGSQGKNFPVWRSRSRTSPSISSRGWDTNGRFHFSLPPATIFAPVPDAHKCSVWRNSVQKAQKRSTPPLRKMFYNSNPRKRNQQQPLPRCEAGRRLRSARHVRTLTSRQHAGSAAGRPRRRRLGKRLPSSGCERILRVPAVTSSCL